MHGEKTQDAEEGNKVVRHETGRENWYMHSSGLNVPFVLYFSEMDFFRLFGTEAKTSMIAYRRFPLNSLSSQSQHPIRHFN